MAGASIGPIIKVDGESEYRQSMKNIITATKELDSELKATAKSFDAHGKAQNTNKQKVEILTRKIDAQKKAISEANDMLEKAKAKYGEDSTEAHQYAEKVNNLTAELNAMNNELKKSGSTPFGATLKDVGGKMQKIGEVGEKIGQGLTTYVTAPLVGIGTMAVASFAEVDKTMALTNKTMGNTADEAKLLNTAMKNAAANSTFGMKDAAGATLNFARAGLDAQQAAAALAPSMNLAAGEGGNLETVSAGLVATINGFGDSFESTGHYADVFAAACNNSALDVDSLSSAMSVAAPIFSAAGYGVEDAALFMGVMANNGIEASVAANSLKTGIARLVSPSKEGGEMMKQLGISVKNADGSMKDSITIQNELHDAFAGLSESEQIAAASAIFGKNQMAPWLALINTAPEDVDSLSGSLEDCAGTTDEMAGAMMSGFGGSIEQLKSSLDVLITSLGEALAPTIQKVVDFVQKLTDRFNSLSPAQQQLIVKIGMFAAAVGPVILVISKIIGGIGTLLTLLPTIGPVVGAVAGVVTGPIGIVVAAIAGIAAVISLLWKKNENFRKAVTKVWDNLKETATNIWKKVKGVFTSTIAANPVLSTAWDALKTAASTIWEAVTGVFTGEISVVDVLTTAWDAVTTAASTIWGSVVETFGGEISVVGVLVDAWDAMFETAGTIWDGVVGLFTGEMTVSEVATSVWDSVTTTATTIWDGVTSLFGGEISLTEIATTVWDNAQTAASNAWAAITGFFTGEAPVVAEIATTAWDNAKQAASDAWDAVKGFFEGAAPVVAEIATTAWDNAKTAASDAWDAIKGFFEGSAPVVAEIATTAWDNAKTAASDAWNAAKGFFEGAAPVVAEISTEAWNDLSTTASDIWTAVGDVFSSFEITWPDFGELAANAFEGLKTAASNAWDWVKGLFGGGGEEASDLKTGEVDTSSITTATTEMQTAFSEATLIISDVDTTSIDNANTYVTDAIKTMSDGFTNMKPKIPSIETTAVTKAKTTVSTQTKAIKTLFTNLKLKIPTVDTKAVTTAKTTASNAASNIKSAFSNMKLSIPSVGTSALTSAYNSVNSKISAIKGLLNFTWKLPSISVPKLPHISPIFNEKKSADGKVTGYGLSYSTSWYDKGGVFYDPAIIGIAEKRPEFVGALDDLKEVVKGAMVEMGGKSGATFVQNNYSPKSLSRVEIYRRTKNLVNMAAMG